MHQLMVEQETLPLPSPLPRSTGGAHEEPLHNVATSLEYKMPPFSVIVCCPKPMQNVAFGHEIEEMLIFARDLGSVHECPSHVAYFVDELPIESSLPVLSMQNEEFVHEMALNPGLAIGKEELEDHDAPFHLTKVPLPDTAMQNNELEQETSTSDWVKLATRSGVLHECPSNVITPSRPGSFMFDLTNVVAAQNVTDGHERPPG